MKEFAIITVFTAVLAVQHLINWMWRMCIKMDKEIHIPNDAFTMVFVVTAAIEVGCFFLIKLGIHWYIMY